MTMRFCGLVFAFCALLSLSSTGLAREPSAKTVTAQATGNAETAFAQGMLFYQQEQYRRAATHFTRTLRLEPRHPTAAYFLGMCHFQQEKYRPSIKAFERAIEIDPDNSEPHFYRALALYRLKQYAGAYAEFGSAHQLSWEGPINDLSYVYRRRLWGDPDQEQKRGQRPWFLYSRLTTQFDSNVTLDPEDISFATLPSDQNDLQVSTQVGGGYHLMQSERYRLTTEASYYQTFYPELDSFNYGLAHVEVNNRLVLGKFLLDLPTYYEFSLLGSSKYMQRPGFSPSISVIFADRFLTRLTSRFSYYDFFQSLSSQAQNRDAFNVHLTLAEYFYFSEQKRYLKVAYSYENNFAKGNDWDYSAHTIEGAFYTPIVWKISAYLFANYTFDKSFDNVDSIIGTRRDDAQHLYGINISRPFRDKLTASLHYTFQRTSSNQVFFQYNKHLVGVTFGFQI